MNVRQQFIQSIASYIEASAPEIATREIRPNYYEGEECFTVTYNHIDFECIRRMGLYDTSNLDYYNGTGHSYDVVYDEIAVQEAYNTITEENVEHLVYEINELLIC